MTARLYSLLLYVKGKVSSTRKIQPKSKKTLSHQQQRPPVPHNATPTIPTRRNLLPFGVYSSLVLIPDLPAGVPISVHTILPQTSQMHAATLSLAVSLNPLSSHASALAFKKYKCFPTIIFAVASVGCVIISP